MRSTCGKEIRHGSEPDAAFSETASGHDFRLQLVLLSEKQVLSHADFSSGAHQALPFIGFARKLAGQENFDLAAQKIARGGILRAEGLRLYAAPPAIEAGGKDAGIVKHDQIVGSQQVRKIAELRVAQLLLSCDSDAAAATLPGRTGAPEQ